MRWTRLEISQRRKFRKTNGAVGILVILHSELQKSPNAQKANVAEFCV